MLNATFGVSRLTKAMMLGGICMASLMGCSQSDNKTADASSASTASATTAASGDTKSVAITAIVEHPALDAVRQGVIEELGNEGFKEGQNLKVNFQSAQGNTATAGQIAKQFAADKPDAIVAIATPSAQSVIAATNSIPVIFSAVTDPVEAKLIKSWEASGTNVTGASDMLPLEPQIELMKKVVPNLKSVGYVYSPGEVNSTVVLKALEAKFKPMGINTPIFPKRLVVYKVKFSSSIPHLTTTWYPLMSRFIKRLKKSKSLWWLLILTPFPVVQWRRWVSTTKT